MPILRMSIITNTIIVMEQRSSLNYIILEKKKQILRHKILTLTKHHHHIRKQEKKPYSKSSSSSILTSHADKTSKKYYIKNDFSQRLSPKLVPHDNRTSKINLKVQDSKSKLLTSTSPAWSLYLMKKISRFSMGFYC